MTCIYYVKYANKFSLNTLIYYHIIIKFARLSYKQKPKT